MRMDRKVKKLFVLAILAILVVVGLFACVKNIKIDEFKPTSIMFVVDASASNQSKLEGQKSFIKQVCKRLDPEDKVKIIKVSQDAYLIYEGSPQNSKNITDSMNEFTKYDANDWGTAYGAGIKKALDYAATMNKEGYNTSIVVIGDLENEGAIEKQINWNTLPGDIRTFQKTVPDFVMFFAYAHPQKLDLVKTKLSPVLGESKLIISTEQSIDKSINTYMTAINR